jgi:hypothetical protein
LHDRRPAGDLLAGRGVPQFRKLPARAITSIARLRAGHASREARPVWVRALRIWARGRRGSQQPRTQRVDPASVRSATIRTGFPRRHR